MNNRKGGKDREGDIAKSHTCCAVWKATASCGARKRSLNLFLPAAREEAHVIAHQHRKAASIPHHSSARQRVPYAAQFTTIMTAQLHAVYAGCWHTDAREQLCHALNGIIAVVEHVKLINTKVNAE